MLLRRRRVLACKLEDEVGVAETLGAEDADKFHIFEPNVNPQIEHQSREGQGFFSRLKGTLGGRGAQAQFRTEMTAGQGGDPGWASVLLPACGWVKEGGIYVPKSRPPGTAGVKTATIGAFEDGLFKKLRGCMGTFVITWTSSERVMIEFTFTGIFTQPVDDAMPTFVGPGTPPLVFRDADITINSVTPLVQEVTLDAGNNVNLREDPSDESGYRNAVVTDRQVTGRMNPEARLVADNDRYGDWLNEEEQPMSIDLSDGDGGEVKVEVPKLQMTNVQAGERNDIQIDEVEYQAGRDSGDDEVQITVTPATA